MATLREVKHLYQALLNKNKEALSITWRGNSYCFYCGNQLSPKHSARDKMSPEWDHILPKRYYKGLTEEKQNLVLSCRGCNRAKSDTHPLIWLIYIINIKNFPMERTISYLVRFVHLNSKTKPKYRIKK